MATEITELEKRGEELMWEIIKHLNPISNLIRTDDEYRREVDMQEMCIALALYEKVLQVGIPVDKELRK